MRASRLQLFRRFTQENPNAPFHEKCQNLKGRFRGKGQFRNSQQEAIAFLDANIGKNLESWLTVKNAIASLSVMSFFEIDHPHKAEIAHWLNGKMGSLSVQEKLECGGVLVGADHAKYVDTVVANVVNPLVRHALPAMTLFDLSIFCKIMQRCGNVCPSEAWNTVATQVQRKLTADVQSYELVRFFSGFARRIPDSAVTLALLRTLTENAKSLKAFDYTTVLASAGRLHITNPLPLELFSKLASGAVDHEAFFNTRDMGTILATIMRMRHSYKATPENINELWKVDNVIQVVLHSFSKSVLRFMDANDERYWSSETDIVALIFAYESSGGKFPEIFKAFSDYVTLNLRKMEARNVALTLGILRRTGYLSDELAQALSDKCGVVMDDFNAPELSHVVFTFLAVRGEYPQWIDRAKSRISSLMTPETPIHARLNIRASFPGETALVSNVDLTQISLRQLHDVLRAPNIDSDLRTEVEQQLAVAVDAQEAPSCAEVEVLVDMGKSNFCGLGGKLKEVARKILMRDNWPVDVGALACLFDAAERDIFSKKAVASAAAYCESPTQFVSFVSTLLTSFPDSMEVREWVVRGATELVKPRSGVMLTPTLAILDLVTVHKIEMGQEWYTALLYGPISENASRLSVATTARVLGMIQILGVPSSHGEPVNFLLQQACERARNAAELLPVFEAAARLKCVSLDEGWCAKLLTLPNLTDEQRALLSDAQKAPSSEKSLNRQEHSVKAEKAPKIVVSGANSGGKSVDAMSDSFEDVESPSSSPAVEAEPAAVAESSEPVTAAIEEPAADEASEEVTQEQAPATQAPKETVSVPKTKPTVKKTTKKEAPARKAADKKDATKPAKKELSTKDKKSSPKNKEEKKSAKKK